MPTSRRPFKEWFSLPKKQLNASSSLLRGGILWAHPRLVFWAGFFCAGILKVTTAPSSSLWPLLPWAFGQVSNTRPEISSVRQTPNPIRKQLIAPLKVTPLSPPEYQLARQDVATYATVALGLLLRCLLMSHQLQQVRQPSLSNEGWDGGDYPRAKGTSHWEPLQFRYPLSRALRTRSVSELRLVSSSSPLPPLPSSPW